MLRSIDTPERILSQVGRRIRAARIASGLTQEDAAAKVGVSYKHWQRIEAGQVDVYTTTLVRIVRAFDIPIAELVTPPMGRPRKRNPGRPPTATKMTKTGARAKRRANSKPGPRVHG